jgi:[acyl-carrier-protein] S-malonyltransferase
MQKFAAVFPGQGSQYPGMGKELFDNFAIARQTFEEASDALKVDLRKLCFDAAESDLKLTHNTQPALLVTSISSWRVFTSETDARPSVALGHSLGEYSALVAAEALSLADAIVTVRLRGQAMQDAVPVGTGGMTAVIGLEDDAVAQMCHDVENAGRTEGGLEKCVLEAANFNSPGQVVVSGHIGMLDYLKATFNAEKYGATRGKLIRLPVSAPFHCSLMKPAAEALKKQLERVHWAQAMRFDVIHNVDGASNNRADRAAQFLYEQMTKPVQWTKSVRGVESHLGIKTFIEFGAGQVLCGLIKKTLTEPTTMSVDKVESLKNTLAAFN